LRNYAKIRRAKLASARVELFLERKLHSNRKFVDTCGLRIAHMDEKIAVATRAPDEAVAFFLVKINETPDHLNSPS
jgi:hypothetical protein